jgi:Mn2+/Fe2+ NRAMP family transporter
LAEAKTPSVGAIFRTATLAGLPPIGLLLAASIAGGLATPVGLVFLLLIARDRAAMHGMPVSSGLAALGWATTAIVAGSGMLFLWIQLHA